MTIALASIAAFVLGYFFGSLRRRKRALADFARLRDTLVGELRSAGFNVKLRPE